MRTSALNRLFHEQLIAAAGSPQAAATLDSLHFPLVKFQFQVALVPGRKADNHQEHQELLRAIKAHDEDGAERAGREHIRQIQAKLEQLGPTTSF